VTIPCTYAGGARSLEDLELFKELSGGKLDITVGSALDIYGGKLPYDQVVAYCDGE
jgi:phosphoribosylformimino-5-aminoimidazole carboxamide ribotide isomerase